MIKYCLEKWNKNKASLEDALKKDKTLSGCDYRHLVELVVRHILNDSEETNDCAWSCENIAEIDNGSYQGTLLYIIPANASQPAEYEYLMAYVGYGSCSGCDTLERTQLYNEDDTLISDIMGLCLDIVQTIIKPYNIGWRGKEEFAAVEWVRDDA